MAGDLPYVIRVEFRDLERSTTSLVGKPIACFKCNAFLTDSTQIIDDEKIGKHFVCPFCGTLNVIEGEIIIAGEDIDVVISTPSETSSDKSAPVAAGKSFLAVLDLSGSMSGASLAAVKRSLTSTIDGLVANSPESVFGLITFESRVMYSITDDSAPLELPPDSLFSTDSIISAAEQLVDGIRLLPVGDNVSAIKQHIQSLISRGTTALGPALVFAYVVAKHHRVSRIIMLTDGLANLGIGSFEGVQAIPPKQFYTDMAKWFFDLGTTVDVVGIASSTGLEMKTLGILPDTTNGQIYYVTPSELDESIAALAGTELLGSDVEVRILTPPGVSIRDASGVPESVADLIKKDGTARIGAISGSHEMCVEVSPEADITSEEVPIQVQVEYTDSTGARRIRVMTTSLSVAHDDGELLSEMDPTVSATFVTQKAGEVSFEQSTEAGRGIISSFREALKKRAKGAPADVRKDIKEVDDVLATEEDNMRELEESVRLAPPTAQAAAADAAYTASLRQKRRSSEELFKKRKKKDDIDNA